MDIGRLVKQLPEINNPPSPKIKSDEHSQQQPQLATQTDVANLMNILNMTAANQQMPFKIDRPVYSTPPPCESNPANNECTMTTIHNHRIAAFTINGEKYICLPQVFESFLKHLVGGLHTVYTKLKRLNITPLVCNVEQVRTLRAIGAIQPGVNRCKLITKRDFEALYHDCTTSSARPGRPPKRYHPEDDMNSPSPTGTPSMLNQEPVINTNLLSNFKNMQAAALVNNVNLSSLNSSTLNALLAGNTQQLINAIQHQNEIKKEENNFDKPQDFDHEEEKPLQINEKPVLSVKEKFRKVARDVEWSEVKPVESRTMLKPIAKNITELMNVIVETCDQRDSEISQLQVTIKRLERQLRVSRRSGIKSDRLIKRLKMDNELMKQKLKKL